MEKRILKGFTVDGYRYELTRQRNYSLNIFVLFHVHIFSKINNRVKIFSTYFIREEQARSFTKTFNFTEEIKKHL